MITPDLAYVENLTIPKDLKYKVVFLESKDDGKLWYRKWIVNPKHTVTDHSGNKFYALKRTGSFMHEDDMAVKWINPHKTVVVLLAESCKRSVDEVFIPQIGWKKPYEANEILKSLS